MANEDRAHSANFNRPPRIQFPELEAREVNIPSPPTAQDLPEQNLLVSVLPVAGIGVMAIFYVSATINKRPKTLPQVKISPKI